MALLPLALVLTGCGASYTATPAATTEAGVRLRGGIHGGAQPVVGAHVYLMAAGSLGYGGPAVPLLTTGLVDGRGGYVLSDASGGFNITGDYTCPTSQTQVYLLATGGNPGLPGNAQNPDLALLAGLGSCGNLSASTYVVMNEVTTVATAYALSGFMTGPTQLSTSATMLGAYGLINAFSTINKLVDVSTGTVRTTVAPGVNASVSASTLNSLADILVSCVNSAGSGAGSGTNSCSTLEHAALSANGTAAADTAEAILNIAHQPGQNVSTLYSLASAYAPFQPTLTTAPGDWSLSVVYAATGATTTTGGIAADPFGNVWTVANTIPAVNVILGTGQRVVSLPTPSPEALTSIALTIPSTSGGPYLFAWLGTEGGNAIKVSPSTSPSGAFTTYPTGMSNVNGVAVAADDSLWFSGGYPQQLVHFDSSGQPTGATPAATYSNPFGLAVDASNNLWVTNAGYTNVSELTAGATYATNFATGDTVPRAVAIGRNGHVWVANSESNPGSVSELAADGSPVSGSPYAGGALYAPWSVAMDGDNHAWFSLFNCRCVVAMGSGGSFVTPSTGIASNSVKYGFGIAVDGSGNVWVANNDTSITEIVGAAAPVVTPLAYAASTNTLGQRP